MHKPPHAVAAPVLLEQTPVGVQVDAGGQGPPMVQGERGVGTAMQRPPVPPVPVGVHVEDGGQAGVVAVAGGERRQGERGVAEAMQRPPQVEVWVQMEPLRQGLPPITQEES
jgi:hypothetical protein